MPADSPTVLLRHDLPTGPAHFDWLIGRPGESSLWSARVGTPPWQWAAAGTWDVLQLPPHRRMYLTYEGPISGDRGTVTRVDEGTVRIETWTEQAATLRLTLRRFQGRVKLTHQIADRWLAQVIDEAAPQPTPPPPEAPPPDVLPPEILRSPIAHLEIVTPKASPPEASPPEMPSPNPSPPGP